MSTFGLTIPVLLSVTDGHWLTFAGGDLQRLFAPSLIPWTNEEVHFVLQFVPYDELERTVQLLIEDGKRSLIAIADRFVEACDGRWRASPAAWRLRRAAWDNQNYCALIGLHESSPPGVPELEAVLSLNPINLHEFRAQIESVACALWYRLPPAPVERSQQRAGVRIDFARTQEDLLDCFKLRYEVYRLLGYLTPDIRNLMSAVEMDAYDLNAIQLVARDVRTDEIAGCCRLILPSRDTMIHRGLEEALEVPQIPTVEWCTAIAEREPALARRCSGTDPSAILPATLLKVFKGLEAAHQGPVRPRASREYCEISRNITAPRYRGMGVSRALVQKVVALAAGLNRRRLILECGPHHRSYYEHFGFRMLDVAGEDAMDAMEAAETLNCVAVALHRELSPSDATAPSFPEVASPEALGAGSELRLSLTSQTKRGSGTLYQIMHSLRAQLPRELTSELESPAGPGTKSGRGSPTLHLHDCKRSSAPALASTLLALLTREKDLHIAIANTAGKSRHYPPFETPLWERLCDDLTSLLDPPP